MDITQILREALAQEASDIILISNEPVCFRIRGDIRPQSDTRLTQEDTRLLVEQIFAMTGKKEQTAFEATGDQFYLDAARQTAIDTTKTMATGLAKEAFKTATGMASQFAAKGMGMGSGKRAAATPAKPAPARKAAARKPAAKKKAAAPARKRAG